MPRFYLDTSVFAGAFLNEADRPAIRAFMIAHLPELILSSWTRLETVSALTQARRRGDLPPAGFEPLIGQMQDMISSLQQPLNVTPTAMQTAETLLQRRGSTLRVGDALHLGIVQEIADVTLVTNDRKMLEAARHEKIPVRDLRL